MEVRKTKKEYYDNFINKNKERIDKQVKCDLCGGTYTYFNKSKHNNTKKHLYEILKNEISELKKNL